MAFYSGNYSTFASLKTSVEAALVAEGWTLSSDILSKGDLFLKLTATTAQLLLQAGTGASGGALTGAAPNGVKLFSPNNVPISFPANYDLHIFDDPDEVYLVTNFNADRYQQLSWGKSAVDQVGGSGMWFTGAYREGALVTNVLTPRITASASHIGFTRSAGSDGFGAGLFFGDYNASRDECSYVHTDLDTTAWRGLFTGDGNLVSSGGPVAALLQALPSAFNQSTVLLPVLACRRRLSSGLTVVVDAVNARLCRNDNHLAGEVVPYGGDQWKVYPFYRKNLEVRNGVFAAGADHSGTFAYAIRYTGP